MTPNINNINNNNNIINNNNNNYNINRINNNNRMLESSDKYNNAEQEEVYEEDYQYQNWGVDRVDLDFRSGGIFSD